jgi:hypothetical protein
MPPEIFNGTQIEGQVDEYGNLIPDETQAADTTGVDGGSVDVLNKLMRLFFGIDRNTINDDIGITEPLEKF